MIPMRVSLSALGLFAMTGNLPAQSNRVAPTPLPAIPAVLDQFREHSIVAMSEGPHNNAKGHEVRMALVRDPRFPRMVDDVVVEFGNARYQSLMDRFVAGGDVPFADLR
jgi:hypothetical protein